MTEDRDGFFAWLIGLCFAGTASWIVAAGVLLFSVVVFSVALSGLFSGPGR